MRTNKLLAFAAIALLIINGVLAFMLWKGKKPVHKGNDGGKRGDWMAKELNLDEKQKEEHKKLRDAHFESVKPLFDSISSYRTGLFSLVKDAAASDSLVKSFNDKIAHTHADISQLTYTHFKKLRTIFNAEQQKKFDELILKMMTRKGGPGGGKPSEK